MDQHSHGETELRKFLSFTIANPDVPVVVWFWGLLIKALCLVWMVVILCVGASILMDKGSPQSFLIMLLQGTGATTLYFLGDGLCHGEKSALHGMAALCAFTAILGIAAYHYGNSTQLGLSILAIVLLYIPPLFSGYTNLKTLK